MQPQGGDGTCVFISGTEAWETSDCMALKPFVCSTEHTP